MLRVLVGGELRVAFYEHSTSSYNYYRSRGINKYPGRQPAGERGTPERLRNGEILEIVYVVRGTKSGFRDYVVISLEKTKTHERLKRAFLYLGGLSTTVPLLPIY